MRYGLPPALPPHGTRQAGRARAVWDGRAGAKNRANLWPICDPLARAEWREKTRPSV